MTTFAGKTIPPLFTSAGGIVTSVNVDNSSTLGIVSWGGFAFPMDPAAVLGHYRVLKREVAGDTLEFDQNWSGEPPFDPPFFVIEITNQVGDFADFGSNGYTGANTACRSAANGGRWERASGVAASLSMSFTVTYFNTAGGCPGVTIFATFDYTVSAVFSG